MKCPNCQTENGYARLETKDWVCRKCGKISPLVFKEKVEPKLDDEIVIQDEKKEAVADLRKKYYCKDY